MTRLTLLAHLIGVALLLAGCPEGADTVPFAQVDEVDAAVIDGLVGDGDVTDGDPGDAPDIGDPPDIGGPDGAPGPVCAPGLVDLDEAPGCEVGCVLEAPVHLDDEAADTPAVAFSIAGDVVMVTAPNGPDRIRFYWDDGQGISERGLMSAGNPHRAVAVAPHGADYWLVLALVSGVSQVSFRMPTNGQGSIGTLPVASPTGASLLADGATTYGGFVGQLDGAQQIVDLTRAQPNTWTLRTQRVAQAWSLPHRVLYERSGGNPVFVGVAEGGAALLLQSFSASDTQPIAVATGNPSWILRGASARVLWPTASGDLGWLDADLAGGNLGAAAYIPGDHRDPAGFFAAGRAFVVSRTSLGALELGVFTDDDALVRAPLSPGPWRAHGLAVAGDALALAMVDEAGGLWLVRGTCR